MKLTFHVILFLMHWVLQRYDFSVVTGLKANPIENCSPTTICIYLNCLNRSIRAPLKVVTR